MGFPQKPTIKCLGVVIVNVCQRDWAVSGWWTVNVSQREKHRDRVMKEMLIEINALSLDLKMLNFLEDLTAERKEFSVYGPEIEKALLII